jgi:hypothetical protein
VPHFSENPLGKLALAADLDQATPLDLAGLDAAQALARLDAVIDRSPARGPAAYAVTFPCPAGDGSETLFLPVGRHLLAARRAGRVSRCLPLPDGNGYYFETG